MKELKELFRFSDNDWSAGALVAVGLIAIVLLADCIGEAIRNMYS